MTTYKVKTPSGWVYIDNQNYDARYILASSKGSNSGVASLDESGHVIFDQLPSSITGAVNYRGVFDPTEGAPSPAAAGYYYVSSGVGTISEISFSTGDWLVYTDGSSWNKIANSSASVTWNNVSNKPDVYTPDTHDNSSHSESYITTLGVTYEALVNNNDVGDSVNQVASGVHIHSGYQPLDGDLTAISALSGTAGLLRKTAANIYQLDTNNYLTELTTATNSILWNSQALPSLTGNALKYIRLNAAGSALEFATASVDGEYASKTESDLTLYVYEDATGDADGSSKANAYTTLQDAIDAIPDVAQNVTVIVCKGSTNYLGQTTTIQKASVKSLTIQGEFYAYDECDANAVAGKVVDANADFSNFEVGDRVVCTHYSGTIGSSSIDDYFYATITEIGSGYIQTSEETKVPTAGWRYLINQTVFDGDNGANIIITHLTPMDIVVPIRGICITNANARAMAGRPYINSSIIYDTYGVSSNGYALFVNSAIFIPEYQIGLYNYGTAQWLSYGAVISGLSVDKSTGFKSMDFGQVYCYFSGMFTLNAALIGDITNTTIHLKSCYIDASCTYGAYGYNITLTNCTNNATTPVYNLTSGGSISQWNLFDLPATTGNGDKYLKLNSGATAFEFATVSAIVDIHGEDSTSEFSTGDEVLIYDSSLGENRKILRGNFFNGLEGDYISIHGTFEETTPATNMELLVYDPSVPANRRMTRANFLDGISAVGAFTDLTDTPASYEGYDETYYVRVNAVSNALEFATVPSSYTLPVATDSILGGIKIGSRLTITDGVLSADEQGGSYTLPTASADTLGGVKIGSGITITDGVISASGGAGEYSTLVQRSLEGVVYETTLMYWVAPATCSINSVSMALSSNPSATGSYCKVQVMKNGTLETNSIFTADTPMQITESTSASNGIYTASGTLDSNQTTLASGDVIQFRVNQADTGSADLLIQMKVTFT